MKFQCSIGFLIITFVLSGCWSTTIQGPESQSFGKAHSLETLIGKSSEKVIEKLGLPDQKLGEGDRRYLIYQKITRGTGVLFLVWVPIAAGSGGSPRLHCLRFEIDTDDTVRDYRVESWEPGGNSHWAQCRDLLWGPGWHGRVYTTSVFAESKFGRHLERELNFYNETFETTRILELYNDLYRLEPRVALTVLCIAVDREDRDAMYYLGEIYEWGQVDFIGQDYVKAYFWFSLAGSTEEELNSFADIYLSPGDLRTVTHALEIWQPGQCKQELGFSE